jgi:hypothetical protein
MPCRLSVPACRTTNGPGVFRQQLQHDCRKNNAIEPVMSATSGTKRRRRREKRLIKFHETLSLRTTFVAIAGTVALLASIAVRSYLSA